MIILFKLFPKTEKKGTLTHLFYKLSIILIPKSDKDYKKGKLQVRSTFLIPTMQKSLKKNNSKSKSIHWKDHTPWSSGIYPLDKRMFDISKSIMWYTTKTEKRIKKSYDHLNRCKKKKNLIMQQAFIPQVWVHSGWYGHGYNNLSW